MILSENDKKRWLSIATETAVLAGSFLLKRSKLNMKIRKETRHDIKIAADTESESIILDRLKKNSDFSILSEEAGLVRRYKQDFIWIVDPLDGSFNYIRGIPLACVSIGLWHSEQPLLGVVYDFNRSELFSGITGKGAWLNDLMIDTSSVIKKEKAVLCTGFPINTKFSKQNIQAFIHDIRSYKKMRLLGSAALSIAYVACGRADAYKENNIMFWDIGGAVPILLGSGGKIDMKKAAKKDSYYVYASNGRI